MTSTLAEAGLGRITVTPSDDNGLCAPSQVMIDKPFAVPRHKLCSGFGLLEDMRLIEVNRASAVFLGGFRLAAPEDEQPIPGLASGKVVVLIRVSSE